MAQRSKECPSPALDDLVIAVETQGQPFAEQHLLRNLLVDEALQLLPGQRCSALCGPRDNNLTNIVCGDLDFLRICRRRPRVMGPPVHAKHQRTDGEEMNKWLTQ